ncbi:MAG: hypothetical protein II199_01455, partial [Bacteroidaceae bacterium]|nr:hypothetical protein [Bacteroidaceae bacterium]
MGQGLWQGTFDNSLSAACVLHEMLGEHLPANVWVALTGDEEVHSNGAKEVCEILTADGINIAQECGDRSDPRGVARPVRLCGGKRPQYVTGQGLGDVRSAFRASFC